MSEQSRITVQVSEEEVFKAFTLDATYGFYPYLINHLVDKIKTKKVLKLIVSQCVNKLLEISKVDAEDFGLRALEETFGETSQRPMYSKSCNTRARSSEHKAQAYEIVKEILSDIDTGKANRVVEKYGK